MISVACMARSSTAADGSRRRILDAAIEVFAERSFDGASTRDIAARAGVTQPLLNYHFSSKDELWRAAVDAIFERLDDALRIRTAGLRGVDPLTTAKLLVREFVHFSAHHPQLHRIITGEGKTDGERMRWMTDRHTKPLYEATRDIFTPLADAGQVVDLPFASIYYILTGAGPHMFVLGPEFHRVTGLDPTADDIIERHADAIIGLLFTA